MLAAGEGHTAVVDLLLSAGAAPNAAMKSGVTAAIAAAKSDHAVVLAALLRGGAAVNAVTSDGRTPLAVAVQHGARRAVDVLLAAGAFPGPSSAALAAGTDGSGSGSGSSSGARRAGGTPTGTDVLPMVLAVRRGAADLVRSLAGAGAGANIVLPDGRSLLLAAVDGYPAGKPPRPDVITALLEAGADPQHLSQEVGGDGRRESLVTRRTPHAAARASGDPAIIAAFTVEGGGGGGGRGVAGGEP